MVYVSYLDMLNILARGIRRAGLPLKMSQGYNPQPHISFAHPLPLGVAAARDYGEFELDLGEEDIHLSRWVDSISRKLPRGFQILEAKIPVVEKPPKLMSIVEATSFEMDFSRVFSGEGLSQGIQQLLEADSITITKITKGKKAKEKDIKPHILNLEVTGQRLKGTFHAGSAGNLRPDEFLRGLGTVAGIDKEQIPQVACTRLDIYFQADRENNVLQEADPIKNLLPLWEWDATQVQIN